MASEPLFLLLSSPEHEKIQMAAMVASVAAVSDRPVQVLVSMGALNVFARDTDPANRYRGGDFSKAMLEKKVPDALELFGQGRMLGQMTMYACSMALSVSEWTLDNLVEELFDGELGLTAFLAEAEKGELISM